LTPSADVSVEALLGRRVVDVSAATFGEYLSGATVLVTGAGGSIGTELCARLARLDVGQLVLVDQAEASLGAVARSLQGNSLPVLADIRSRSRSLELFEIHRPDVVFHAAAYKQVPLLEASPCEAVATNVVGTQSVVEAARVVGVKRFVLFSTDKAVQPASILGQTKCVAEWIVAGAGESSPQGRYAVVRLGNVIDSAGSILPLFREQLVGGKPLPVTDARATRYLMTAGEAAGLASVAGALADSESVFFLDLGPPVTVLDLATRFASAAAGAEIEFVGLRAGERLHERMCWSGDELSATPCEHVVRAPMHCVDSLWLEEQLVELASRVERASAAEIRALLAEMHTTRESGNTESHGNGRAREPASRLRGLSRRVPAGDAGLGRGDLAQPGGGGGRAGGAHD
jgi:FlaA1/EpsC-like NDP-sugar epimerase